MFVPISRTDIARTHQFVPLIYNDYCQNLNCKISVLRFPKTPKASDITLRVHFFDRTGEGWDNVRKECNQPADAAALKTFATKILACKVSK